jgi:quinol monooxygenase YgiN
MLRHIVMLNFRPQFGQEQRREFIAASVKSLAQIPGTHNVIIGTASEVQGKAPYEIALFVDFEDEAALKSYLDHPTHKAAEAQLPMTFSGATFSNYKY